MRQSTTTLTTQRRRRGLTKLCLGLAATAAVLIPASPASAEVFGDEWCGEADLPLGLVSFADELVDYSPGPDVGPPSDDGNNALGWQPLVNASLGDDGTTGGSITVRFTDNTLEDQNVVEQGNDLYVFECGGQIEAFTVSISADGTNWLTFSPTSFRPSAIDIGSHPNHVPGTNYQYVRVEEFVDGSSYDGRGWSGADIQAIAAIGGEEVIVPVASPLPAVIFSIVLGGVALGAIVVRGNRGRLAAGQS